MLLQVAGRNSGFRAIPAEFERNCAAEAQTSIVFNPAMQYWTSRGFAVLDVDYRPGCFLAVAAPEGGGPRFKTCLGVVVMV